MPTQTGEINVRELQGEKSTRTEKEDMQEMFRLIMAKMDATKEELRKDIEENSKKMEENLHKKMDSTKEDLSEINKKIINDRTSPGEIEEILKCFHGTKYFSTWDMVCGYCLLYTSRCV